MGLIRALRRIKKPDLKFDFSFSTQWRNPPTDIRSSKPNKLTSFTFRRTTYIIKQDPNIFARFNGFSAQIRHVFYCKIVDQGIFNRMEKGSSKLFYNRFLRAWRIFIQVEHNLKKIRKIFIGSLIIYIIVSNIDIVRMDHIGYWVGSVGMFTLSFSGIVVKTWYTVWSF